MVVVFPAPLCPSKAVICPSNMSSVVPATAKLVVLSRVNSCIIDTHISDQYSFFLFKSHSKTKDNEQCSDMNYLSELSDFDAGVYSLWIPFKTIMIDMSIQFHFFISYLSLSRSSTPILFL